MYQNKELIQQILQSAKNELAVVNNSKYSNDEIGRYAQLLYKCNFIESVFIDTTGSCCVDGLTPEGNELLDQLQNSR